MSKFVRTWRYGPEGQAVLCETQEMFDRFVELGYKDSPAAFEKTETVPAEVVIQKTVEAEDVPKSTECYTEYLNEQSAQKPKPRRRR
jgi:hypothetical protein